MVDGRVFYWCSSLLAPANSSALHVSHSLPLPFSHSLLCAPPRLCVSIIWALFTTDFTDYHRLNNKLCVPPSSPCLRGYFFLKYFSTFFNDSPNPSLLAAKRGRLVLVRKGYCILKTLSGSLNPERSCFLVTELIYRESLEILI
jgi:hypothetical protein